jgi:hypothetical protein
MDTRIDGSVRREEFESMFFRCAENVAREHSQSKLNAYVNFMVSVAATEVQGEILDYILSKLERLSSLELRVLATTVKLCAEIKARKMELNPPGGEPKRAFHIDNGERRRMLGVTGVEHELFAGYIAGKLTGEHVVTFSTFQSLESSGYFLTFDGYDGVQRIAYAHMQNDFERLPDFIADISWRIHDLALTPRLGSTQS